MAYSKNGRSCQLSDIAPLSISGTSLLFLDNRKDDELVHDYVMWWCNINSQHSSGWKPLTLLPFEETICILCTSQMNKSRKQGLECFQLPTASTTAQVQQPAEHRVLLTPTMSLEYTAKAFNETAVSTGVICLNNHWNHTLVSALQNWCGNTIVPS